MAIRGTRHDDILSGSGTQNRFKLGGGGNDTAYGGDGHDTFEMKDTLTADDRIYGGQGYDTLELTGLATGDSLTFTADTFDSIERIEVSNNSVELTTVDANVAAGKALTVITQTMLHFDGSAETDGHFNLYGGGDTDMLIGGDGNDNFRGNGGADTLTGGRGGDTFYYLTPSHSSSTDRDTITDFQAGKDIFIIGTGPAGGFDGTYSTSVSAATVDSDMGVFFSDVIQGNHAWAVEATGGDLIGHTFVVVDTNNDALYSAGVDFVFDVTGYTGTLTGANFI